MTETLVSWCSRSAEPRSQAALLEVSGLAKSFGPLTVLREVSLQAGHGEIVGHGASPRGTDVTVRTGGAPGRAAVRITDYGADIPAGLADKTLGPRVRGSAEVAGTGLGLPIARGIIEAHGGTLVVAPADPGASFVVALPADPPPDPRPATAGEPSGTPWNVVEEPEEQRGG
jgi:light-regulated signal transduction histidine kinase (bacteriophytochrome)